MCSMLTSIRTCNQPEPDREIARGDRARALAAEAEVLVLDEPTASPLPTRWRVCSSLCAVCAIAGSASSTSRIGWMRCSRSPIAWWCCATAGWPGNAGSTRRRRRK